MSEGHKSQTNSGCIVRPCLLPKNTLQPLVLRVIKLKLSVHLLCLNNGPTRVLCTSGLYLWQKETFSWSLYKRQCFFTETPASQNGYLGFVALHHLWLSHWAWEAPALASWVAEIMRVSHGQALAALNQIINFCLLPEVVYFPLVFFLHSPCFQPKRKKKKHSTACFTVP